MSGRVFTKVPKPVSATPTHALVPKCSPRVQALLKPHNTQPENSSNPHGGAAFDFTKIPLFPTGQADIQAKLIIGHPHDKFEREADSVADTVMRRGTSPSLSNLTGIQEGKNSDTSRSTGIEGGQPLPKAARAQFEPHLGFNFSQVRIHTSKHSVDATQALNARAFTMGRDIFFGNGQYAPQTSNGQRLLAHELSHVVQQGHAASLQPLASSQQKNRLSASSLSTPTIQASFISFAIKMGAKKVAKGTLKNFIKTQIKGKLRKLASKKFARRFAKEADDLVGILEDPWWATAIGFIPVVGDAFDLVRVPKQIVKAMRKADRLEEKIKTILRIQGRRARNLIPESIKKVGDYPSELEHLTYAQIVKQAGRSAKARKLKKLIEQQHRLLEK